MRRCFIVHLRHRILAESGRWRRITRPFPRASFQLEHLCLEHQINFFMGSDCHIESLFGALKSRGFNLEDTHLKDSERLSRLLALLALAFTWAFVVGLWQ